MRTWRDVLHGNARWSCEATDCRAWLAGVPDDSIDMLFTSPPYMKARSYGRDDVARDCDSWVSWMLDVVRAAAPKVKGLIAVVCEGQTADYRYQPAPFILIAELHRDGFNLRKPCVYEREGIPGSGGPDWLKNRWEPIICVSRPGRLPWSDNTACGNPPKFLPGGDTTNRTADGIRVSEKRALMKKQIAAGLSQREAARVVGYPLTGVTMTSDRHDTVTGKSYVPPDIANPGNIIDCGSSGSGHLGHALAHDNEAPFPLELATFFVKSFCPPGGVVCDPFSGSGTTCHAAVEHGRRFVGCDIRESQIELCERRLLTVTPSMFSEAD